MSFASIAAGLAAAAVLLMGASLAAFGQTETSVLTFHNNYQRWGWNAQETTLTPSALSSTTSKFGVIAIADTLDSPIYAQPLIVPQITVGCPANQIVVSCVTGSFGVRDVVFVATSNNSVYAIDADSGAILLQRNFGPQGTCGGIWSTPVIDPVTGILYLIAHVTKGGVQSFELHALDIGTLTDVLTPYVINGANTSSPLTNGKSYAFDSTRACQRPGLLLLNGKIYAAFSGYEYAAGTPPRPHSGPARGWVLAWNASDLSALTPFLANQQASEVHGFYLTSIWMSGSGIASDGTNLYFVTGNSNPSGLSYDPVENVEESAVELTPDLQVSSIFTPWDFAYLDRQDFDFGSGGIMILPNSPPLAVAAGKDGKMRLMNGDSLGGYTPGGPDNVLSWYQIGGCWCAPAFYQNATGNRVVSSGGSDLKTWKLWPGIAGAYPRLVQDGDAVLPASFQDGGFFTSVSSNGLDSAVIWAVGRPSDSATNALTLYAYDGAPSKRSLTLLGKYPAGTWNDPANALSVPVVANGKVYVVSGNSTTPSGTLTIFGIVP